MALGRPESTLVMRHIFDQTKDSDDLPTTEPISVHRRTSDALKRNHPEQTGSRSQMRAGSCENQEQTSGFPIPRSLRDVFWHGRILKERLEFGRRLYPALPEQTADILFVIEPGCQEWTITNSGDISGVWLNGRTLPGFHSVPLKAGDVICANGIWLMAAKPFLFCSHPLPGFDLCCSRNHSERSTSGHLSKSDLQPRPAARFKAEAPCPMTPVEKPHWFTSLGPCTMILASSLASALVTWSRNSQDWAKALSDMATPLSMAAAFLGFGLINRQITIKAQKKPVLQQEKLYESCLQELAEQMDHARSLMQADSSRIMQALIDPDTDLDQGQEEPWMIPCALSLQPSCTLEMPVIRYDQKEDPLVRRLENLARRSTAASVWLCLESGQTAWIKGWQKEYVDSLFQVWCRMAGGRQRRFVYLGDSWSPPLAHPACFLDRTLLVFKNADVFTPLAAVHPQIEWMIVVEKPGIYSQKLDQLPGSCLVLQDTSPSAWHPAGLPAMQLDVLRRSARRYIPSHGELMPDSRLCRQGVQVSDFRKDEPDLAVDLELNGQKILDLESMGPHMLVAGTTGSGKSEGMTHLLLQLTLQNSSRFLQYILIDFKGGAFGSAFYEFPHLAGYLTNMEASSIGRLEQALDQEIVSRQKKLASMMEDNPFSAADLPSWNTLHPQDPISHLIILVDEFASLKKSCPEFLDKLQESARIGRSLGIHLILSTQKPAGVVDAQTFANARIRMSFMVQSAADSREVLGHDEASRLKRPGEFICEINGQSSLRGRMAYTRAPVSASRSIVLSAQGRTLNEPAEPATRLEAASALILQAKDQRKWILCPDLRGITEKRTGLFRDCLTSLEPFELLENQPVWLQAPEDHLMQAADSLSLASSLPVYTAGKSSENADEQIPRESFWQIPDLEKGLLLVFVDGMENQVVLDMLNNRNLCIVLLSSRPLNRRDELLSQCRIRLGCSLKDKEEQYLLFGRGSDGIPAWPLVHGLEEKKHFRAAFCMNPSCPRPVRKAFKGWIHNPVSLDVLLRMPPCLLGFDVISGRPVFWQGHKPLLLVWTQPELGRPASMLLELWRLQKPELKAGTLLEQEPVALLELPRDASLLNTPEGVQALYSRQICFLGKGLRDWMFQLKLSGIPEGEGNAVLMEKEPIWLKLLETC